MAMPIIAPVWRGIQTSLMTLVDKSRSVFTLVDELELMPEIAIVLENASRVLPVYPKASCSARSTVISRFVTTTPHVRLSLPLPCLYVPAPPFGLRLHSRIVNSPHVRLRASVPRATRKPFARQSRVPFPLLVAASSRRATCCPKYVLCATGIALLAV
ncbi:hypothetical protein H4582DRAFT_1919620 [Lactarius indigo]|nr:hypothetical protein H4582DRAFT_1919620 [Lactarius indigo]